MDLTAPVLQAQGLRRAYGGVPVVDVDHLEVGPGEVVAVLGPNGAGKSTLFRLLLLLEAADAGTIRLLGRDVRVGDAEARRRITGVFQRPFLFAGSVEDNVAYGLRARGVARGEQSRQVAEALERLALAALAKADVRRLSGGEAQRVALARSLVLRPDLLLLDEPTANLDVTARRRFREDLERVIREDARAVVLITHDPADAFALADRIVVLDRGRVVQRGTPEELVLRPETAFVAAFAGAELLLDGIVHGHDAGLVEVEVAGGARIVAAAAPDAADRMPEGAGAHIAYRPEDVVLAPADSDAETSARNRFRLRVADMAPTGGLVRVRLEGPLTLAAHVTRASAESLGLAPGREIVAQLKATALRAFPAPER